ALAYTTGRNLNKSHIYASYGVTLAKRNSRSTLNLVKRCKLPLDLQGAKEWSTLDGGGVFAVGVQGDITGRPITGIGLIDDPHKNRKEAESAAMRAHAKDWYNSDFLSRIHVTTSIICIASRFHVDDLPAHLIAEHGFEYVRLPAVVDDGDIWDDASTLLAPELYTHQLLREKAKNDYEWWSLYMGLPRPRGESLFGQATTCALADLPRSGRDVIGIDLAYTKKTKSDRTAAVVLREHDGDRYVVEVLQFQLAADKGVTELQALSARYPHAPMVWHGSSTEAGGAQAIRSLGLPMLRPKIAVGDKFVRAQETAAAWRSGRVIVPRDATWTTSFLDVVQGFTGVNDSNDDAVDALTSAFDELGPLRDGRERGPSVRGLGYRRPTAGLGRAY
nr:hypothetical protein [Myxococcota bacterium]